MRDLDRLIQILASANGAVVSDSFAADCRQAAEMLTLLRSPGVLVIARERERQVSEEGWTPGHDDMHDRGEMALAAAEYANAGACRPAIGTWPWDDYWWKPKSPLRDLERGGALMAAEIDRLLREADRKAGAPDPDPCHLIGDDAGTLAEADGRAAQ